MKPSREETLFVLSPTEPVPSRDGSVLGAVKNMNETLHLWRAPLMETTNALEAEQRSTQRK